jgi:hypothetical protein
MSVGTSIVIAIVGIGIVGLNLGMFVLSGTASCTRKTAGDFGCLVISGSVSAF